MPPRFPHALALALLATAACADNKVPVPLDTAAAVGGNASTNVATPQANPVATPDDPSATQPVSDPVTVAQIDTVILTAGRNITQIPTNIAVPLLQRLEERLDATKTPPLTQIADGLGDLRGELGKDKIDGKRVGSILLDLGNRTSAVGGNRQIAGAASDRLTQLGELLTQAGRQLGGTVLGRTAQPR